MGYELDKGRLDLSAHPFSMSAHPTDSRVTTRIHASSIFSSISTVLHEGGHSLYEMNLPEEHFGSPLGEAISMAVHESQSRWWETLIGLSLPFWKHYLPILKEAYPGKLDQITLEQFYRAINKVEPSPIRVEADEVTYPLHVILRFEMESALIEGSLAIRDIPALWNQKMETYLGITPKDNREGCLQDVHWSMGGFGYFPSYALGNMYAAHLFTAFRKSHPDWESKIAKGELLFIKEWLKNNVHTHGRHYNSQDLLLKVTGKPFTEEAYLTYLKDKYLKIYKI
jgi:carboxypeptidase Taq